MNGERILDTNLIVAAWNGDHDANAVIVNAFRPLVPSIVIGELYYGAYKSGRVTENVTQVERFAETAIVIACNAATAKYYGIIKQELRAKGKPIPENDIWIAALTLQHNLTLVTRDAHFEQVNGLKLETW